MKRNLLPIPAPATKRRYRINNRSNGITIFRLRKYIVIIMQNKPILANNAYAGITITLGFIQSLPHYQYSKSAQPLTQPSQNAPHPEHFMQVVQPIMLSPHPLQKAWLIQEPQDEQALHPVMIVKLKAQIRNIINTCVMSCFFIWILPINRF